MDIKCESYESIDLEKGMKVSNYPVVDIKDNIVYTKDDQGLYGFGMINTKNNQPYDVIKPQYPYLSSFKDGVAIYGVGHIPNKGLIDILGNQITKPRYCEIEDCSNGLYIAKQSGNHKISLINKQGQEILKDCHRIEYHPNQYFTYNYGLNVGVLNYKGEKLFQFESLDIEYLTDSYFKVTNNNGLYGIVDLSGNYIIKPKYSKLKYVSNDLVLVCNEKNKWMIINFQGKVITKIAKKYDDIVFKHCKYGITTLGDMYGLIDINAKTILKNKYYEIDVINEHLVRIHTHTTNKRSLYSIQGKLTMDDIYGIEYKNQFDTFSCYNYDDYDKSYIMDAYGEIIYTLDCSVLRHISNDYYLFRRGTKYYYLNISTKEISNHYYDEINSFQDGIAVYQKDGLYGLIDDHFNELTKPMFESIKQYEIKGNLIALDTGIGITLINRQGKIYFENMSMTTLNIIDDNSVIIDNTLIRLKDIKIVYNIDLKYYQYKNTKSFNSEEERSKYLKIFSQEIEDKLNMIEEEYEHDKKKIYVKRENKIKELLK